jgi:hypothetical protein
MPEKVTAWQAADGTLYASESDAKDHDFKSALAVWFRDRFPSPGCDGEPGTAFFGALIDDRMKLLPIFKLLNGGTPVTAPPQMPDRASADVVTMRSPQA